VSMPATASRLLRSLFLVFGFTCACLQALPAQMDAGPLISITSPDAAATFVYGSIKEHSLVWNKKEKVLVAHVTFVDTQDNSGSANEDTHEFRLPGITLDEAKGIFFARSAKGELVPVAHFKKILLFKSIETLPNAIVHILRSGGDVSVILEAVRPDDPALRATPGDTRQISLEDLLH
jgi:hypothetical protein